MTFHCAAIYEGGVLRPLTLPQLAEGQRVEIIIMPVAASGDRTPAEILAAIAALPIEGGGDPFTSRDHDRILYGGEKSP